MRSRMSTPTLARRLPFGVLALGVLVAGGVVARAQKPADFRTETDAVPIDVVVVDNQGRPVSNLDAASFTVTVDGKPRKIVSAQFLSSASAGGGRTATASQGARWDIDEAFDRVYGTNEKSGGGDTPRSRTIVIAVDQSTFTTSGGRTAALASQGLLDLLHPDDRVGLVVFPPPGPSVRATRDRERVRAALRQVTGVSEPPPRTDVSLTVIDAINWNDGDANTRGEIMSRSCSVIGAGSGSPTAPTADSCIQSVSAAASQVVAYARRQTSISLIGLSNLIRSVAVPDAPTTVVLISTGLYGASQARQLGVEDEIRNTAQIALASRATIYALFPESGFLDRDSMDRTRLAGFSASDTDMRLEGLRYLASLSGGTVTRVTSGSDEGFRRVSLELSAYYLLGVEGLPSDRDGQRHRIRVRVDRPGTTVRAREDLYFPVVKKLSGDDAVREALRAPTLQRTLPLQLSTQMLREPDSDKVRLVISAQIDRGLKAPTAVRVGYQIRGAGAAATAGVSDVQNRKLPLIGTGNDTSLAYVETASLTPGRYLLRLAAVDEAERVGSVEQVIDALLVGGEVGAMSDLLLVDPARIVKETFAPVADGRMTGDAVEAFVEIYPNAGRTVGSVAFDISDTPGGPSIASTVVTPEKGKDRLTAGVNMDVRALPPGTYMLNVRLLEGERLLGRTSRPFRLDRLVVAGSPRAAFAFAATGGVVRNFQREDALRSDAIDYFLGRLRESDGAGTDRPAVGTAAAALRNAKFDAALSALGNETPDALAVAFVKGLALFGQGQLEPAAAEFRAALRLSNDFLPAAFYLGACYAAGGRDREAVGAWQTSLISEGDSRIIYEVLADAWLRLKDGGRAQAIIAEAQERWPSDDVFAPRLAAAKVLLNRRADAFAALEPYLERHPSDAEPLFLAIRLLYEAFDAGKPIKSAAKDRELAAKFGALYREAEGANQALVARWVGAMAK
jgi:VWFA-related protein